MSNMFEISGPGGRASLQSRDVQALSDELRTDAGFQAFKADPRGFASNFGIELDDAVASRLINVLGPADRLSDVRVSIDEVSATAAVVAEGAAAVTSSKVAVAF